MKVMSDLAKLIEKEYEESYSKKNIIIIIVCFIFLMLITVNLFVSIFSQLYGWAHFVELGASFTEIKPLMAFGLGFKFFISPYILPLIIPFLCFIIYISAVFIKKTKADNEMKTKEILLMDNKAGILICSSIFILCLFAIVCLGEIQSFSVFYKLKPIWSPFLVKIGGAMIFFLGVSFISSSKNMFAQNKCKNKFLDDLKESIIGFGGMFIISVVLGFIWAYKPNPYFYYVFLSIASTGGIILSTNLLLVYFLLGLALPFVLIAFIFNWALTHFNRVSQNISKIIFASGILLMFMGILVFLNLINSDFLIK